MRRVVFNQKGGVGKTSITCNLAAISASRGKRTLVIDLDAQANSSHYLLGDLSYEYSVADYLEQSLIYSVKAKKACDFVFKTPFENLYIMPACQRLPEIEHKLASRYKIFALKKALEELQQDYDEIFIDTPPALNFYTKSALIGADKVLIPFDCDSFSRNSLDTVSANIFEIRDDHNEQLSIEGVVVNQFQSQAKLPRQLVDQLIEANYPIIPAMLSSSVKMRESHQAATPLIYYSPKHKLTAQFEALYQHLTEQPL